jgi:hypothetical protein
LGGTGGTGRATASTLTLTSGLGQGQSRQDAELQRGFTPQQLEEFAVFMGAGSVQPGTLVAYRTGEGLWRGYLGNLSEERRPMELLEDVKDIMVMALHILAFAIKLYQERGWRGVQITAHFAAIGLFLSTNVENAGLMKHSVVDRARAAVSMTREERAVQAQHRIDHAVMPVSYDMLDLARRVHFVDVDKGTDKGRSSMAAYLATAMMMDTGNRVSSATGPRTDRVLGVIADHGIRFENLELTIQHPSEPSTFALKGGPALHKYLQWQHSRSPGAFPGVVDMRLTFLTQKVVRKGGAPDPLFYGRRSEREVQFMEDLLLWCLLNHKLLPEDYLYTRYQLAPKPGAKKHKRLLQSRDVALVVKGAAEAFGYDPRRFCPSSARRFLAASGGLEDKEMKQRVGWSANSTAPATHYLRNFEGRGAFAVNSNALTQEQIRRRVTMPLSKCPDFDPKELDSMEEGGEQEGGDDSAATPVKGEATGADGGEDDSIVGLMAHMCDLPQAPRKELPVVGTSQAFPIVLSPMLVGRGERAQAKRRRAPIYSPKAKEGQPPAGKRQRRG